MSILLALLPSGFTPSLLSDIDCFDPGRVVMVSRTSDSSAVM